MKKHIVVTASALLLGGALFSSASLASSSEPMLTDSVGVEKKDGKRFILHRVDEGQTLFAIARRYGRSVAEIKAANPDMTDAVRYDQLVRIPLPDGALSRKQEKAIDKAIKKEEKEQKRVAKAEPDVNKDAKRTDDPARSGIHVVEPGQTLYSLAVRYGVSQDDLRRWNSLSANNVLIGQALIVSEKAYQARNPAGPVPTVAVKTPDTPARTPARTADTRKPEPARTDPPRNDSPKEDKQRTEHAPPVARTERTTPTPAAEPRRTDTPPTPAAKPAEAEVELPRPGNDAPMPTRGRRLSDSGVAEIIEGDGSGKYLALHRTAPIGTLVQVRNLFNNQSLWVKVIGRLPDTGVNDKILIKLSAQAFAKLSPEDRRFRAEVSYIVR
ncbi:LysM repeat protein [Spirosoma lacussanchae]|uniref:LysM peptidoglycan-binding domain-containing protein n=1 Tax=Spirosoma lacussanchae TaxID=1884249 RepID=UPI0011090ABC|nr:LysM peptidoglycan-binding domain-containing protein [Spirosoma lacussanchae]